MCAADPKLPPFPVDGLSLDDTEVAHAGITMILREGFALTRIMPFRAQATATARALAPWWEGALPKAGCSIWSGDSGLAWAGANCWLLVRPRQSKPETGVIAAALQGLAAVTDASDGFLPLDLRGPDMTKLLAKGCNLDLDRLEAGASTPTQIAHTRVLLMRLDNTTCRLMVPASHVQSMVDWLQESAAEFGLSTQRCKGDVQTQKGALAKAG